MRDGAATSDPRVRLTAWVEGRVQGVGFRWWVRSRALALGLAGSAANLPDGRVQVVAEGGRRACAELLDLLDGDMPPGRVTAVAHEWAEPRGDLRGFAALSRPGRGGKPAGLGRSA